MQVEVSAEGKVALPESIRDQLGLRAGDSLDAKVETEDGLARIVLTLPEPVKKWELKLTTDPLTGLPVLSAGPGAPMLTSEMVEEMLADFP